MCSKIYNNIPSGQASDYGIRIYKDHEVYHIKKEDARQRWSIMVFETKLHVNSQEILTSGIYVAPSFSLSKGTDLGTEFKGYLFSVPFESWKALDIYSLEAIFQSDQFVPYRSMSSENARKIMGIMNLIYLSLDAVDNCENTEELTYLCWALMATIASCYTNTTLSSSQSYSKNIIVNKFVRLVNEHCPKEKKLSFYASEIGITPKYLSYVIANATGKNANRWICDCTIKKSKELLLATPYPVEKVAELMGFRSSADFCRTFRSHSGMTPLQYRRLILSAKTGEIMSHPYQN